MKLLEKAKLIKNLEHEKKFRLVVQGVLVGTIKPDFCYYDCEKGVEVVEDTKGNKATQTEAFRLRWKVMQALYPQYDYRLT